MDMFMTKQLKQSSESNFKKIKRDQVFLRYLVHHLQATKTKRRRVVIKNHKRSISDKKVGLKIPPFFVSLHFLSI